MGPQVRILSPRPEFPWPRGQAVKTSPFHGGNTGSSPVEVIFLPLPLGAGAFSSVGQSGRLITDWSGVQVPEGPLFAPGPVVQLVSTPACHAGGRGFEPLPGRHCFSPGGGERHDDNAAGVAQLAEQLICNQQVAGSSPFASSIFINMGRFPSGQREQTVNLPSQTSVVRIHPCPLIYLREWRNWQTR